MSGTTEMHYGCDHCGLVTSSLEVPSAGAGRRVCPECGGRLRAVRLSEALSLAREREEARGWRARSSTAGPARDARPMSGR